jgi:hypothetical protein
MAEPVVRRFSRSATYRTWCADRTLISRLVDELEGAAAKLRELDQPAKQEELQKPYANKQEVLETFDRDYVPDARVRTADERSISGPLRDALAAADLRQLIVLEVRLPRFPSRWTRRNELRLEMLKDNDMPAVRWRIEGQDQQWVLGTHAAVNVLLKRGVPRWRLLRSFAVGAALGVALATGAFALLVWELPNDISNATAQGIGWAYVATIVGLGLGCIWLMRRLFPPLDLYPAGERSRASTVLRWAERALGGAVSIAALVLAVVAL